MSVFSKWFSGKKDESDSKVEQLEPQLSASEYCEWGQKSLDAGEYDEAMEYFQAAIETDNRFKKAYILLASVYEKQGMVDKAKSTLCGLLTVDPDNVEALRQIEVLNKKHRNSQINKSNPSVSIARTEGEAHSNASQSQQSADGDKFSARNIGCALFGAIICIPCGIILFLEDNLLGGFSFVLIALLCITGPFINRDFWK